MTAQVPDTLLFRGKTWPLCAQPLYRYLTRLRKSRRPQFAPSSTSNWRGYTATWEIRGDMLHLVGLEGALRTPSGVVEATLQTALPWVKESLAATWVTDDLRCVEGRLLTYIHAGYASRYERDRLFRFEGGKLVDEFLVLNPPDEIVYRIAADGSRTCVEGMLPGDAELSDPLGEADVSSVYGVWGKRPDDEGDPEGYSVLAWTGLGVGPRATDGHTGPTSVQLPGRRCGGAMNWRGNLRRSLGALPHHFRQPRCTAHGKRNISRSLRLS